MNTTCTYRGNREELLVAYLYDEVDPSDRAAFEEHIAACAVCGRELDELGVVRSRLGHWTPPEPARAFTSPPAPPVGRRGGWAALGAIPAWAQVAAALLCGGVAAGVANLDVKSDRNGLSVRTWWRAGCDQPRPRGGAAARSALACRPRRSRAAAADRDARVPGAGHR
jgi:anti-sigma factor RsiW